MLYSKIILIHLMFVLSSVFVFANEHGEAPPAGGHGGAAAPAEKPYSGNQNDEWLKVQTQLITVKGKVETQKVLVEGLIAQKAHSGGHSSAAETETLQKEHENLMKLIEEFNALNTNFQNRFPEKGAAPGRVYKRINPDSLEVLEKNMTLEGRLKRLSSKIKKQYTPDEDLKNETVKVKSHDSEHGHSKSEQPHKKKQPAPNIDVTDQIILQK